MGCLRKLSSFDGLFEMYFSPCLDFSFSYDNQVIQLGGTYKLDWLQQVLHFVVFLARHGGFDPVDHEVLGLLLLLLVLLKLLKCFLPTNVRQN